MYSPGDKYVLTPFLHAFRLLMRLHSTIGEPNWSPEAAADVLELFDHINQNPVNGGNMKELKALIEQTIPNMPHRLRQDAGSNAWMVDYWPKNHSQVAINFRVGESNNATLRLDGFEVSSTRVVFGESEVCWLSYSSDINAALGFPKTLEIQKSDELEAIRPQLVGFFKHICTDYETGDFTVAESTFIDARVISYMLEHF